MMRIRWTTPAAQDLYRITRYIRRDNPNAAREVAKTIHDGCQSLIHTPHRGRKGIEPGTCELVFSPLPSMSPCTASRNPSSKSCVSGTPRKTGLKTLLNFALNHFLSIHAVPCGADAPKGP